MVDPGRLRRRLVLLQDALADLKRYRATYDRAAILESRDVQHMVSHALYVAAQSAIDIALHAAADVETASAGSYQQAFARLASAGRIPVELTTRLAGWAGLRNILARHDASVDYGKIASTLATELPDLDEFAALVTTWV